MAISMRVHWTEPHTNPDLVDRVRTRITAAGHEFTMGPSRADRAHGLPPEELAAVLAEVDGALVSTRETFTNAVLSSATRLRVLAKIGVGVDAIDVGSATRHGILVTNTPIPEHAEQVAEGTVARILALAKHLAEGDELVKAGRWTKPNNLNLKYASVGIIGYGRIGRRVAELLIPFGTRILVHSRDVEKNRLLAPAGVDTVDLDELLHRSDVVSLHALPNPDNMPLLGREQIDRMRPGAFLVNTARGSLVDETALADALEQGRLAAAAVDVFSQEPPLDSPLLRPSVARRVLLTTHTAGTTREVSDLMLAHQVEQCLDALAGRVPRDVVNRSAVARWSERIEE